MKRRNFLMLATGGAGATVISFLRCRDPKSGNPALAMPYFLSATCDAKTLQEIGSAYRAQWPAEDGEEKLINLVMLDEGWGPLSPGSNVADTRVWLDRKISRDFSSGRIDIIKGWVISKTEARQCALFSLQQN